MKALIRLKHCFKAMALTHQKISLKKSVCPAFIRTTHFQFKSRKSDEGICCKQKKATPNSKGEN